MGRELKRVPMDFDWPIKKIWRGYLNPWYEYASECPECSKPSGGLGYNKEIRQLARNFYSHSAESQDKVWNDKITQEEVDYLLKKNRLRTLVLNKETGRSEWKTLPRKAQEINYNQNHSLSSHDAINRMLLIEFRAKKMGIWGKDGSCETCKGDGTVWYSGIIQDGKTAEQLSEEWEDFEPPKGEGYQLWETTTEGSPVSPVFSSLDGLAEWCENNSTTFWSFKTNKEKWLKMLKDDYIFHEEGGNIFT